MKVKREDATSLLIILTMIVSYAVLGNLFIYMFVCLFVCLLISSVTGGQFEYRKLLHYKGFPGMSTPVFTVSACTTVKNKGTRSVLRYESPAFVILPSFDFPPLLYCDGVSPSPAADDH